LFQKEWFTIPYMGV